MWACITWDTLSDIMSDLLNIVISWCLTPDGNVPHGQILPLDLTNPEYHVLVTSCPGDVGQDVYKTWNSRIQVPDSSLICVEWRTLCPWTVKLVSFTFSHEAEQVGWEQARWHHDVPLAVGICCINSWFRPTAKSWNNTENFQQALIHCACTPEVHETQVSVYSLSCSKNGKIGKFLQLHFRCYPGNTCPYHISFCWSITFTSDLLGRPRESPCWRGFVKRCI